MRAAAAIALSLVTAGAAAQSKEVNVWDGDKPLEPFSRTAIAITGPVRVAAHQIRFGDKPAPAQLEGRYWRDWTGEGKLRTASVYALQKDPGTLRNGNTLCGNVPARYAVLWLSTDSPAGPIVNMGVFSSPSAPHDGSSPGLCGTFSYVPPGS